MDTEIIKPVDLSGQVIGSYQISTRLGRGGMADVYKALHTELNVNRAIKFIRPELVTSEDFVVRFQKEAQAVAKLEHPNIVRIHDFGNANNQFYMVMQFVDGFDLKNYLAKHGALPTDTAIDLVISIAGALTYAHERDLIHRDIKPENIMFGDKSEPILMDFGIAKLLTENTAFTKTGFGIGTPAYMAPEQAQGLAITPATDIYALSVVLYELVTGRQPYSADTPIAVMLKAISDPLPLPREINPEVTEELQAVILKGTAKDPLARYQSADEFAADLRLVRGGGQPTIARKARAVAGSDATTVIQRNVIHERPSASAKYVHGLAGIGALAVVCAVGAGLWWMNSDPAPEAQATALTTEARSEVSPESSSKITETAASAQAAPIATPASTEVTDSSTPTSDVVTTPTATPVVETTKPPAPVQQLIGGEPGVIYEYRQTMASGEIVETTLNLEEGEAVYLRVHTAEHTTDIKLTEPDGRGALFNSYSNAGPFIAKVAGEYRLSMQMRNNQSGDVDMQIFRINPAVKAQGAVIFDDYTSGTTEWPGQRLNYQLDLTEGDTLFLEIVESAVTTDFTLRTLDDRKNIFSTYHNSGPHSISTTGIHQFHVDPRNEHLADYEFILHKLNPAIISGGDYMPDSWAEGATAQPGQTVEYLIELDQNDVVFLEITRASVTTDFILKSPDGRDSLFASYHDTGPHRVKNTGIHSLMVDPRNHLLSDYEFKLHRLTPAIIDGGRVALDQTISARTDQPGQIAHFELELAEAANVALEVISATNTTDFKLMSPDGRSEIFSSYHSVPAKELQPGKYQLIADPRQSKTSDFEFQLTRQP